MGSFNLIVFIWNKSSEAVKWAVMYLDSNWHDITKSVFQKVLVKRAIIWFIFELIQKRECSQFVFALRFLPENFRLDEPILEIVFIKRGTAIIWFFMKFCSVVLIYMKCVFVVVSFFGALQTNRNTLASNYQ